MFKNRFPRAFQLRQGASEALRIYLLSYSFVVPSFLAQMAFQQEWFEGNPTHPAFRFKARHEDLAPGDYASPKLILIKPDPCFPQMVVGNVDNIRDPLFRREIAHTWCVPFLKILSPRSLLAPRHSVLRAGQLVHVLCELKMTFKLY